jgi:hypothetical protein
MNTTFWLGLTSPKELRIESIIAGNIDGRQIRKEDIRVKSCHVHFCEGFDRMPVPLRFMFQGHDKLWILNNQHHFIGNMMLLKMSYFNSISPDGVRIAVS